MKKINLSVVFPLSILLISLSLFCGCDSKEDEEETIITLSNLPSEARNFLNSYYKGIEVSKIEKDLDEGVVIYEVLLKNGHEVVFNEKGEWEQVDAPSGESIPTGFIPLSILEYLDENFAGYGINEINKTGYGYKVELITELDLMFNEIGQYIGPVSDD